MKKKHYLNLFGYLKEFTKLRSTTVTDIRYNSQYLETIWFADLLRTNRVKAITFGESEDQEYWLKAGKPGPEPKPPKFKGLTSELAKWVDDKSLLDEANGPNLKDSIWDGNSRLLLAENQDIGLEFEKFVDQIWFENLEDFKAAILRFEDELKIHKFEVDLYGQLFNIYNKVSLFKEEFEVVLGFGLLHFNEDVGKPYVCRHLFTTPAEVIYNEDKFDITVCPAEDFRISIESEFIENVPDQFDSFSLSEAERIFKSKINESQDLNVFGADVKLACNAYASTMRSDGTFVDEIKNEKHFQTEPRVFFSPAVILRKRDTKGITNLYKTIIENVEKAEDDIRLPLFDPIIGFSSAEKGNQSIDFEKKSGTQVYFPNLHNEEQFQIALKAARFNNVLVQGPPGTGKSLTISNLICDLIAKGNKVLVTAQTERALKVLGDKLPEEFQKLSVSLLGSEHPSKRKKNGGPSKSGLTLESTINAIQQKQSEGIDLKKLELQIQKEEELLQELKENLEFKKVEWAEIRKSDVQKHHIDDRYSGTLLEIARKLEADSPLYKWYEDDFSDLTRVGIKKDILDFLEKRKKYINEIGNELNKSLPDTSLLLSVDDFKKITNAKRLCDGYKNTGKQFLEIRTAEPYRVLDLLKDFENTFEIFNLESEFIFGKKPKDFQAVLNEIKTIKDKSDRIHSKLNFVKLEYHKENITVRLPENKDLISLKGHLNILLSYAQKGNPISGWQFSIKKHLAESHVKSVFYLLEIDIINSKKLQTVDEINHVLEHIHFQQFSNELESIWRLPNRPNDSLESRLEAVLGKVNEAVRLKKELEKFLQLKNEIEVLCGLKFKYFTTDEISLWSESIRFRTIQAYINVNGPKVQSMLTYLDSGNFHFVAQQLKKAITDNDPAEYEKCLGNWEVVSIQKADYKKFIALKDEIFLAVPKLYASLKSPDFDRANLDDLPKAIAFRYAQKELQRLKNSDAGLVQEEIRNMESKILKMLGEIGSKKAWYSTLQKLYSSPGLVSHLVAWSLAAQKMKGTGKRALKFRTDAQVQMGKCQDAVPCWIMPLYKIADTITPDQQMFDYIIVDEASQLSADALFLLYLGKKIVVVGDDKQTAPEFPGISEDIVKGLIAKFLKEIPFGKFLGLESSFFDQSNIFAESRMALQEHFRCMPEIIEFSNQHFYKPIGKDLYPLRQYSENRLQPLKSVYCSEALMEGDSNKEEAQAIAEKIAELVKLPEYEGKNFGVIALQGNSQADLIEREIKAKIGLEEYDKREIVCGNSASFQGDERNVMFLSMVIAPNKNRLSLTKPEYERRYNVAASRAKDQMWLFYSVHIEDLAPHDLRHKLLNHFLNYQNGEIWEGDHISEPIGGRSSINLPSRFRSWFEVDVFNEIVSQGYKVIPNYKVVKTKYEIDLVPVLPNGTKVAIECDGDEFHGPEQLQHDLSRQIVLERCGWRFFRIRGSEYYSNRKKALEPLWKMLEILSPKVEETLHQEGPVEVRTEPDFVLEPVIPESVPREHPKVILEIVESRNIVKASSGLEYEKEILVFTNHCNVYKIYNSFHFDNSGKLLLGLQSQRKLKESILEKIEFNHNEKALYITGTSDYAGFMLFGFDNGNFAKVNFQSYQTITKRKKLEKAYSDAHKIVFIQHFTEETDLVLRSSIDKILVFNTNQLSVIQSKSSPGVQVMRSKNGSILKAVEILERNNHFEPEYYRVNSLPAIGNFLRKEDKM
jgi:hypothetical protein